MTGPDWTLQTLELGFSYLTEGDYESENMFPAFSNSNILMLNNFSPAYVNLPPASSASSSTTGVATVCQAGQDAIVTFQATLADSNVTGSNPAPSLSR